MISSTARSAAIMIGTSGSVVGLNTKVYGTQNIVSGILKLANRGDLELTVYHSLL